MPYKRVRNVIYTKSSGSWKVKQRCSSPDAAKRALRLLNAVEHGFKPTGKT